MDWFQFISSMTGSIAWPVAILGVALVFKKPIHDLIPRITDFELWGSKATFSRGLQEAEETANKLPEVDGGSKPESSIKPDDPYLALAERYPEAAVMDSFKWVEAIFDEYRTEFGLKGPVNTRAIMEVLLREENVSSEVYHLYRQIADTRNAAVHVGGRTISAGEAISYRDLCFKLVEHLQKALKRRAKSKGNAKRVSVT